MMGCDISGLATTGHFIMVALSLALVQVVRIACIDAFEKFDVYCAVLRDGDMISFVRRSRANEICI